MKLMKNPKNNKAEKYLLEGIQGECDDIFINGSETDRVPGNINLSFAYVEENL